MDRRFATGESVIERWKSPAPGVNDSPINITINNRSANQQAWDSTYSPVLEWAHDNGYTSPVVGDGGTLAPSVEERGGVSLGAEVF